MANQITPNPSVPSQVVAEVKFPKFINNLGIIPTSYKDSMSYYECLAWLCKFLEEQVIPTVNENGEAVEELQALYVELNSYVTHYFDTLDVQEEINNKLDDMVEQGTLQEIIADYLNSKAVFGFDTVADMKEATNLIDGSYAKTLGFYSINDGGGATYKIRNLNPNETIDEKFILSLNNSDTIIAELVYGNEINVNQLGAKQDESEDASAYFNAAFSKINSRWINNDYTVNTVVCGGKYLINNTINMTPFAKLTNNKFTSIKSNVTGSTIKISYYNLSDLPDTSILNKYDWFMGNTIDFSQGCIIYSNSNSENSIGIEIGDTNYASGFTFSRMTLKNFRLKGFNVGIYYVGSNTYLIHHEKISFEQCTTGVNFPTSSVVNAGEKMSFENCLFAGGDYGIKWNISGGFHVHVNNCSFDFVKYCISDVSSLGYHNAFITNSHIEGFNNIVKGLGDYSLISITNCVVVDDKYDQLFANIKNNPTVNIIFKNIQYTEQPITDYNPNRLQLCPEIDLENFIGTNGNKAVVFNNNNLVDSFDSLADGDYTYSSGIGNYTVFYAARINSTVQIVTDNYLYTGHKSLVITRSTTESGISAFDMVSDFIPIKQYYLQGKLYTYNMTGTYSIKYSFYDINKELISETDTYFYTASTELYENKWYMPLATKQAKAPKNASYFKVSFYCNDLFKYNDISTLPSAKIGGLIVN